MSLENVNDSLHVFDIVDSGTCSGCKLPAVVGDEPEIY